MLSQISTNASPAAMMSLASAALVGSHAIV